jgi:hypothetical protein
MVVPEVPSVRWTSLNMTNMLHLHYYAETILVAKSFFSPRWGERG